MRRALCWLTKAFLSVLPLKKRTVQPIFVSENMNLFVHGCRGQTWQNTLIQMCHSEALLSSGWYLEWDKAFTISPLLDSSIIHCTVTVVFVFKGPGTWWQGGYTWLLYLFTLCDFVFYHLYVSLTVFVCCVTRTYKVFTRWLRCKMTMLWRFLQRRRGGKKEEKRNIFNNLPIVSLIQWHFAVLSKSQLPQWRSVCSGFCHAVTWVIFLYQTPKACLEQLPPSVPSE